MIPSDVGKWHALCFEIAKWSQSEINGNLIFVLVWLCKAMFIRCHQRRERLLAKLASDTLYFLILSNLFNRSYLAYTLYPFFNIGNWSTFIKVPSTRADRRLWTVLLPCQKCDKTSSGIGKCCFSWLFHNHIKVLIRYLDLQRIFI